MHTPMRRAFISTDPNSTDKFYFEYANGTPGDLIVEINRLDVMSWEQIVSAVNSHEDMLAALRTSLNMMRNSGETHRFEPAYLDSVEKTIAKAEGRS